MTFGPDGKLYVVIGDLNRNGQLQTFLDGPAPDDTGVIFRINDDGSTPTDNPFSSQADLARYYAYGVRNSFDYFRAAVFLPRFQPCLHG